jgi:16S rRNA (cytosine967-C5)-methyltransferase
LPAWVFARWRAAYGERAASIAASLRAEPPLDLTIWTDRERWAQALGGTVLPTGTVRLPASAAREQPTGAPRAGVEGLAGYSEGAWWVQDAAAALPARLLGEVKGEVVLDLCAAPGGKTLQLAAEGARVTALDKAEDRLDRLRSNLRRTGLEAEIVCADALEWSPARLFDAVLLDAPCTSTGTLRRHPDAAWLRRPNDVRTLAALQASLLARTSAFLRPGGRLVYSVCSLEPEEGPDIVAQALNSGAWRRGPKPQIGGADDLMSPEGELRTLPCHWVERGGMDGFYAALLLRQ